MWTPLPPSRVILDQPLPLSPALFAEASSSASLPVARALRAHASRTVAQDLSVGTAVAACMSLLVAAAVAGGGGRGDGGR